jgi:hypothetical protein
LLNYPVDQLFELLSAPTADAVKLRAAGSTLLNRAGKRMSNVARRASAVARRASAAALDAVRATAKRMKLPAGFVSRKIPDSTVAAQALAAATAPMITSRLQSFLLDRSIQKYEVSQAKLQGMEEYRSDSDEDAESESEAEGEAKTQQSDAVNPAVHLFARLKEEIDLQRSTLLPNEVEEFDASWGIDPTGEFTSTTKSSILCWKRENRRSNSIMEEISFVQEQVARRVDKLEFASDAHTG